MNYILPIGVLIVAGLCVILLLRQNKGPITIDSSLPATTDSSRLRYIAMGDSYTIGEGVKEPERWPNELTKRLNENGIGVELVGNVARTGWTTQNLIDTGLPIYKESKADFATLLIGVNDWVQGIDEDTFRKNFLFLLDQMLTTLPSSKRLLVVTIPDFGVTPTGKAYGGGRDISEGVSSFNEIVMEESRKKNVTYVDIFELSKGMGKDMSLINWDGLHPSSKEYILWTDVIYPSALVQLR